MDGNKDESERCVAFAKKFIVDGDVDKALKYLRKADKLFPSQVAKDLMSSLQEEPQMRQRGSQSRSHHFNGEVPNHNNSFRKPKTASSSAENVAADDETKAETAKDSNSSQHLPDESTTTSGNASPKLGNRVPKTANPPPKNGNTPPKNGNPSPKRHQSPTASSSAKEYTTEQLDAVKRVKKCKDYYEILGVSKECNEAELKKQYRKLALQFHPDKNMAPGAAEAFKAIGNAFAVLSDPNKKRQYDLYGSEEAPQRVQRQHRGGYYSEDGYYYDYTRGGFEGDISAEEIFNMFFGGGFPSGNVYVRRNNTRWTEQPSRRAGHSHESNETASGYSVLLQMMPVLVLLCLSLMSSFFVSDPAYSLVKTQKYIYERKTTNLEVSYYVKESFERDYKGNIRRIEAQVEEDFVSNLRTACFREKNYRESMIWRAKNFRDKELEDKARALRTPSCDHLQKISSEYMGW